MLVSELIYSILDLLKATSSDDVSITEEHVLFLCKKFRSFLIRKEQEKENSGTSLSSEFEYQQICLDLEKTAAIDGEPCTGGYYLRTTIEIPKVIDGNTPRVYPIDFYQGINVVFVPRDRMRYVGTNKFLQNIIYVSLGPDMHLYLKSNNPQFLYLRKLRMSAVFEDFDSAVDYLCDNEGNPTEDACNILNSTFPIREYLVPTLIELVVKELSGSIYRPADSRNNSADDLSDIMSFLRSNMKSAFQKQLDS